MKKIIQEWSFKEVNHLKSLRQSGKQVKECMKILNRTYGSISKCLHRHKIVMQPKSSNIRKIIKKLVLKGRSDNFIAFKINKSVFTVIYHRRKLKLKANQHRTKKNRLRCIGCNKLAPVHIANGTTELIRWKTKRITVCRGLTEIEAHCEECFKEYGWGDLIESKRESDE